MSEPRRVFVPCPDCGGDGEVNTGQIYIDRETGARSYIQLRCEYCNGTGRVEEDANLIDETDLDEMVAA